MRSRESSVNGSRSKVVAGGNRGHRSHCRVYSMGLWVLCPCSCLGNIIGFSERRRISINRPHRPGDRRWAYSWAIHLQLSVSVSDWNHWSSDYSSNTWETIAWEYLWTFRRQEIKSQSISIPIWGLQPPQIFSMFCAYPRSLTPRPPLRFLRRGGVLAVKFF